MGVGQPSRRDLRGVGRAVGAWVALALLSGGAAWAQKTPEKPAPKKEAQSALIELTPMAGFGFTNLNLGLTDKKHDRQQKLTANTLGEIFVGLDYKGWGASVGVWSFGSPDADALGARSDYLDLQLHHYRKHWIFDVYLQRYRGFSLEEASEGCEPGEPCAQRPDLSAYRLGATVTYGFDEHYGINTIFDPVHRKMHSAGSWLVTGGLNATGIRDRQSLWPGLTSLTSADFFLVNVGGGYGYIWASDWGFFIHGSLVVQLGYAQRYGQTFEHTPTSTAADDPHGLSTGAGVRIAAGYDAERWGLGLRVVTDLQATIGGDLELSFMSGLGDFYVAYRF